MTEIELENERELDRMRVRKIGKERKIEKEISKSIWIKMSFNIAFEKTLAIDNIYSK